MMGTKASGSVSTTTPLRSPAAYIAQDRPLANQRIHRRIKCQLC